MTDTSNAIGLAPAVQVIAPYAVAIACAIVTWTLSLAATAFTKWTGVRIDRTFEQHFEAAATTEAAKMIAAAADNMATAQIKVDSPMVVAAAQRLLDAEHLQAAIVALGMTPARAAAIVTGELGKLQAIMTSVTPPKGAAS